MNYYPWLNKVSFILSAIISDPACRLARTEGCSRQLDLERLGAFGKHAT